MIMSQWAKTKDSNQFEAQNFISNYLFVHKLLFSPEFPTIQCMTSEGRNEWTSKQTKKKSLKESCSGYVSYSESLSWIGSYIYKWFTYPFFMNLSLRFVIRMGFNVYELIYKCIKQNQTSSHIRIWFWIRVLKMFARKWGDTTLYIYGTNAYIFVSFAHFASGCNHFQFKTIAKTWHSFCGLIYLVISIVYRVILIFSYCFTCSKEMLFCYRSISIDIQWSKWSFYTTELSNLYCIMFLILDYNQMPISDEQWTDIHTNIQMAWKLMCVVLMQDEKWET